MLIKNITILKQVLVVFAAAGVLSGCGGGADSNPVPPGAEIDLSMTEYQWEIAPVADPCIIDPNLFHDHLVNIAVTNSAGLPLGDVEVNAALDLSAATYSGTPVMALYDDKNGNGAGDDSELVSGAGQGAYTFRTDEYAGTKALWVRVNLSCPYSGTLTVFAGAASAVLDIEVIERAEAAE